MPCNSLTCQLGDKRPTLPPVSSSRLRDGGRRAPISTASRAKIVPAEDTLPPPTAPAAMVLAEPIYQPSGSGTGDEVQTGLTEAQCTARGGSFSQVGSDPSRCTIRATDVDCWTDPSNAACAGNPANITGKQSSQSDLDAVGTIQGIGRTAADLLGAYSSYQMRDRTANREDQRLQLERERTQLENQTRVALAEIEARGRTPESERVAADLRAQLALIQGQQSTAKNALMIGGIVVGVGLVGLLAWKALTPSAPKANPGRRLYKGRRK